VDTANITPVLVVIIARARNSDQIIALGSKNLEKICQFAKMHSFDSVE